MTWTGAPSSRTPAVQALPGVDKGRQLYTEPAIPVWDELETKMAERLVTALRTSRSWTTLWIAKAIKDMAAQSDDLLKKAGLYGTD